MPVELASGLLDAELAGPGGFAGAEDEPPPDRLRARVESCGTTPASGGVTSIGTAWATRTVLASQAEIDWLA